MQFLVVLLLAVSASATYDYGQSYYPSSYGNNDYYGYSGFGGYSGLGYGVGGYSYAPTSYYSGGGGAISKYLSPAVTSYASPAVTSYAAPAVTSYAAPAAAISYAAPAVSTYAAAPAVSYVKPAVTYAAAPAVSYAKPAVTYAAAPAFSYNKPAVSYAAAPAVSYYKPSVSYAAAPAVSYAKPAVSYAAAPAVSYVKPAVSYAAAPRYENPTVKGGSLVGLNTGSAIRTHSGISSIKGGSAFNLHQNKDHSLSGFGETKQAGFHNFPKSVADATPGTSRIDSENSKSSNVKSGVEYVDDKPEDSTYLNEKPSDTSFFDATKSSEADNEGFDLPKPDSNDRSSFDSDSFFDEAKFSETDDTGFETTKPDSKDKKSFDSDRSHDSNDAGFDSMKTPHSHSNSAGSSRFDSGKVDVENKQKFPSRFAVKQSILKDDKSLFSTDKPSSAGSPNIKFVIGPRTSGGLVANQPFQNKPYPIHVFRDGPTSFHSTLRDRVFYINQEVERPAYDLSSVYGPSTSLLYDGGYPTVLLDGVVPEEGPYAFYKK